MKIKFTHEAKTKGYSFVAGEVHKFPDKVGELIILDGVAFCVSENEVNENVTRALNEAKSRDRCNR